ncbi:hypothetical protein B7463_g8786, partial [Scytalidium lignicola]
MTFSNICRLQEPHSSAVIKSSADLRASGLVFSEKGPSQDQGRFQSHVEQVHAVLDVNQLGVLLQTSQRHLDAIPAGDCPFCEEWEQSLRTVMEDENTALDPLKNNQSGDIITVDLQQFRHHVAFHMEQLAIFAIPRDIDGDGKDSNLSNAAVGSTLAANKGASSGVHVSSFEHEEWLLDPPLHIAAARGDLDEVKGLLSDGADVHSIGETWGTAINAASSSSNTAVYEFLFRYATVEAMGEDI